MLFRAFPCFSRVRKEPAYTLGRAAPRFLPEAAHLCFLAGSEETAENSAERAGLNLGSSRLEEQKVTESDQKGVFLVTFCHFLTSFGHFLMLFVTFDDFNRARDYPC